MELGWGLKNKIPLFFFIKWNFRDFELSTSSYKFFFVCLKHVCEWCILPPKQKYVLCTPCFSCSCFKSVCNFCNKLLEMDCLGSYDVPSSSVSGNFILSTRVTAVFLLFISNACMYIHILLCKVSRRSFFKFNSAA